MTAALFGFAIVAYLDILRRLDRIESRIEAIARVPRA